MKTKIIKTEVIETLHHIFPSGAIIEEVRSSIKKKSQYKIIDGTKRNQSYFYIDQEVYKMNYNNHYYDDFYKLSIPPEKLMLFDDIDTSKLINFQIMQNGFLYPFNSDIPLNRPIYIGCIFKKQYKLKSLKEHWKSIISDKILEIYIVEDGYDYDDIDNTCYKVTVVLSDDFFMELYNENKDTEFFGHGKLSDVLRYNEKDYLGFCKYSKDDDD